MTQTGRHLPEDFPSPHHPTGVTSCSAGSAAGNPGAVVVDSARTQQPHSRTTTCPSQGIFTILPAGSGAGVPGADVLHHRRYHARSPPRSPPRSPLRRSPASSSLARLGRIQERMQGRSFLRRRQLQLLGLRELRPNLLRKLRLSGGGRLLLSPSRGNANSGFI